MTTTAPKRGSRPCTRSSAASAQQKGYAAYYLATLAWYAGDYDVARVQFREARDDADSATADLARQMLQSHWGE